ncbi:hypothetical protein ACLOJK_003634 [Asimina triloba]
MTVLHAGGKFGGSSSGYSVSGGLHGVGLSVVNALSEISVPLKLEVTVWRDGKEFRQRYGRGKPVTSLIRQTLPPASTAQGTCIRFWPDREAGRIRELAFLNPEYTECTDPRGITFQLAISLSKEDSDPKKTQQNEYCYAGGLVEYVRWLNTDKLDGFEKPLHDVVAFSKEMEGIRIDIALQWCADGYTDTMLGYANSIRTVDGGTHIDGMKASLTRTLNSLGKKSKILKV